MLRKHTGLKAETGVRECRDCGVGTLGEGWSGPSLKQQDEERWEPKALEVGGQSVE